MTYVKYKSKDYAQWQLLAGISAVAVSLQLKPWEGAEFPSLSGWEYFIGTLEKRTGDVVTAKERVLVSARATDTVTFTRSFWGDTAIAFDADDYFCLHVNSDIIIDIQDEVTRLETDKLNGAGWLRTALTNRRTYYSNGSWAETALALWSNWTYLKSNGASSAPTWEAPPLDINSQTTETVLDPDADYVPVYDASAWANRKYLAKYIKNLATNAQAWTWTDTVTTINPYQLANYPWAIIAWTTYTASSNAWSTTSSSTYTKKIEWTIVRTWTYRVWFTLTGGIASDSYARIYKNWVAYWTERHVAGTATTAFSEDLSFNAGDLIQLYQRDANSNSVTTSLRTVKYSIFDYSFTSNTV